MLVITGPGRCGSTLLAAFCKMMGHDPGGAGGPDQDAGFEDPEVQRVHRLVLAGESDRAAALARSIARSVVKDPRFVTLGQARKLISFWTMCRPDIRFLVLQRDLASVAASFASRPDKFERADGGAILADLQRFLAEFHTALAEVGCPSLGLALLRPDVRFREVRAALEDWGGLALHPNRAVVQHFGLHPRRWTPAGVWASWFDPARIHHHSRA